MNSIKIYTGDDGVRSYICPQEFIDRSHIKVTVDDVELTQSEELTLTTYIVEDQSGTWYITIGNDIALTGLEVVALRDTPTAGIVDFVNGSTLQDIDLTTAYRQAVYVAEEAKEQ